MKEIHLLCNAHIDPVWHWKLNEGIGAAISTFRIAAEIAEESDGFIFNHNEAILYMYIEKYDPELFERIKKLVKDGKWHILGGWYLQPDCVMPTGESILRQIDVGKKYFYEKFGVNPTTAVSFDAFGHTKGLVQIFEKCGYDSYIFCRPNPTNTSASIPYHTFKWNGFADSSVTAINCAPYNTPFGLATCALKNFINNNKEDSFPIRLFTWGVGNHGGGPSKEDVRDLKEFISNNENTIIHSTAENFITRLNAAAPQMPEYDKSLCHVMVGCYTSQSQVKQSHRKLENSLKAAEIMASHATAIGTMKYPHEQLAEAQKCLLLSEFHDILPGSSSKPAMDSALISINRGLDIAESIKTDAFYHLSYGQPKGERRIIPLLVYNPTPYTREFIIDNEFTMADQNYTEKFNDVKVWQGNKLLPSQLEKETSNIPIDWRKRVVFRAKLEAMSMNRFDLELDLLDSKPERTKHTERFIEVSNGSKSVIIDKNTGFISRYSVNGKNLLTDVGKLTVIKDNHDPWGMKVASFNEIAGSFVQASPVDTAKICNVQTDELEPVRIIEDGAIRTKVESVFTYQDSHAVITYIIDKQTLEINIHIDLLSNLKHEMAKFCIGSGFANPLLNAKTSFGIIPLDKDGSENVSQEYILMGNEENTVSIIKQGIYGSDFKDDELRISLCRGANYCAHPTQDRQITLQDRYNYCLDQGLLSFDFCINADTTENCISNIESDAAALSTPPEAISFYPSETGTKPESFCKITNPAISIERICAEKNGSYTVHIYNGVDTQQTAVIEFAQLKASTEITLKPYEIMALSLSEGCCEPSSFRN